MPIDIVKKNKKNPTVNLKRKLPKEKEDKEGFEERLEKRFSHLPELAYKQKVKIMWSTVIFCSGAIVICWFYLASRGVLFHNSEGGEKKDDLIKFSELVSGFNELKGATASQLSEKKDFVLNLKNKLEAEAAKNEVINNLKDSLQKKFDSKGGDEINKVVCDSGNLITTYPLPDYYINSPVKILGRGKLPSGEFEVGLEDSNGKILGQSGGTTEKGQIMSSFAIDLNYSNPETKKGILELYTLGEDGESKDNLISIPVNFILDLKNWNTYNNEEFGIEFNYPKNLPVSVFQNGIQISKENNTEEDGFYVEYFDNVQKLQENYMPDILSVYESLDLFLESGNLGENQKSAYFGGLEFNFISGIDAYYIIFEKETGEIVVFRYDNKGDSDLEVLDQILATFRLVDLNLDNWKEYEDLNNEVIFKYPARLNESEEMGQFVFREDDPDGFSFYFFAIEPQIDNLEKWVKESSVNLEEEIINYEDKSFGDAIYGVYYEAQEIKDDLESEEANRKRSFGYIFNHYGATYSLRTNKDNFQNTFKNILGSIKFNSPDVDQDISN